MVDGGGLFAKRETLAGHGSWGSWITRGEEPPGLGNVEMLARYFRDSVRRIRLRWLRARILRMFAKLDIAESELLEALTPEHLEQQQRRVRVARARTRHKLGRPDGGDEDDEWLATFLEFMHEDGDE